MFNYVICRYMYLLFEVVIIIRGPQVIIVEGSR